MFWSRKRVEIIKGIMVLRDAMGAESTREDVGSIQEHNEAYGRCWEQIWPVRKRSFAWVLLEGNIPQGHPQRHRTKLTQLNL
jgi:hypothetical protein